MDDSPTVNLASFRARRAASASGPTVQAVRCPSAHLSPAHAPVCRVCGIAIVDRQVHTVPRPGLGRLRFDSGVVVELERPLLLGRHPPADALIGDEPAVAVAIPDPDAVLSRVHLAVALEGWQVVVTDRESLNHTYVQLPGMAQQQLRPGIPLAITAGTRIELGETVGLVFEVP